MITPYDRVSLGSRAALIGSLTHRSTSDSTTVPAGASAYVPEAYEIGAAGVLEIGSDAVMEIG